MKNYGIQDFKKINAKTKQECVFGWFLFADVQGFKKIAYLIRITGIPILFMKIWWTLKKIKNLFCHVYCNNTSEYHVWNFPAFKKIAQHTKGVENIISAIIFIAKNRNEKINILSHETQDSSLTSCIFQVEIKEVRQNENPCVQ